MMRKNNILYFQCIVFWQLALWSASSGLHAQINFVPNPGFEDLIDCELDYGRADKASPWQVVNAPVATPDLFHNCSESGFFVPPSGCFPVYPRTGEGMAGLAQMNVEERIYAPLTAALPVDTDIYVAYAYRPRQKCGDEFETFCYANTNGLAFADAQLQWQQVVIESDTIIDNTEEWTFAQSCYQATGNEKVVLLGNVKLTSDTLQDCDYIAPDFNSAYYYVDDLIVTPFDVVPDTLWLCGDDSLNMDATFYEVPISWGDGWQGALRTIDEPGVYTVLGDVGRCLLSDKTVVIQVPDELEEVSEELCEGGELELVSPFPAVWENGETDTTFRVSSPGRYTASLLSVCGEREITYTVEETDCRMRHFVPTAFSPNGDGVNDELAFYFDADVDYEGDLSVFDRWGNQLFQIDSVNPQLTARWDGTFKGRLMDAGVYVWFFQYQTAKEGETKLLSGHVNLIR